MKIIQMENVRRLCGGGGVEFPFFGSGIDIVSAVTPANKQSLVVVSKDDGTNVVEKISIVTWDNPEIKYNIALSQLNSNGQTLDAFLNLEQKNHNFKLISSNTQDLFYFDSVIIYK